MRIHQKAGHSHLSLSGDSIIGPEVQATSVHPYNSRRVLCNLHRTFCFISAFCTLCHWLFNMHTQSRGNTSSARMPLTIYPNVGDNAGEHHTF